MEVPIDCHPHWAILHHLHSTYGINAEACGGTEGGLDNSVYSIYRNKLDHEPSFVFKIVETRSAFDILRSIQLSSALSLNFTKCKYIRTSSGHIAAHFYDKIAVLMSYVRGRKLDIMCQSDIQHLASFIGAFHARTASISTLSAPQHAEILIESTHLYWTHKVQVGLAISSPLRKRFYNHAFGRLLADPETRKTYIQQMEGWPGTIGLTHGDLHNDNLLVPPSGNFSLIDFDCMRDADFQLTDVLQALARWPLTRNFEDIETFLTAYFEQFPLHQARGRRDANFVRDASSSVLHWLPLFVLKAMLSIDFYTFEVGKYAPDFPNANANAKNVLTRLQECFEECVGHINEQEAMGMRKKMSVGEMAALQLITPAMTPFATPYPSAPASVMDEGEWEAD